MTAKPKPKAKAHGIKAVVRRTETPSIDMRARNPSPLHRIIGNRIRTHRIAKHMSQQELGERLGLTFQQVQKYERGANRVDSARLFEIAEILEVDVMDLYGDLTKRRTKDGPTDHERYMATSEGNRLLNAMVEIDNAALRWRIVQLAEAIGRDADEEHPGDVDE